MDLNNFETNRLWFRPFLESDFSDLFGILGNEEVCKYLPVKPAYSEEQVKTTQTFLVVFGSIIVLCLFFWGLESLLTFLTKLVLG